MFVNSPLPGFQRAGDCARIGIGIGDTGSSARLDNHCWPPAPDRREARIYTPAVTIYKRRTYDVFPSEIGEVIQLYQGEGWPTLEAGGFDDHLVGYFISDTGTLHQLVHIWRFDDDSARRDFWNRLRQNQTFMHFVGKLRPLLRAQDVQLLSAAPWEPTP